MTMYDTKRFLCRKDERPGRQFGGYSFRRAFPHTRSLLFRVTGIETRRSWGRQYERKIYLTKVK